MPKISAERIFEFGKYNGLSVESVMKKDPQYIEYLLSKIEWIFTDEEKRHFRNMQHCSRNKDIYMQKVKTRTVFEEEMYEILRNLR